jgi:threonine 3-dehydrogenase
VSSRAKHDERSVLFAADRDDPLRGRADRRAYLHLVAQSGVSRDALAEGTGIGYFRLAESLLAGGRSAYTRRLGRRRDVQQQQWRVQCLSQLARHSQGGPASVGVVDRADDRSHPKDLPSGRAVANTQCLRVRRSYVTWQDGRAVETMRAIRKRESAPGLTLEEVPVPTPAPDEVLVRIEAASICGTDLHIRRWDQWSSERVEPPLTLGHELCGTVVATGSSVRDIAEGDYVSAESHVTCGVCFHCRTGKAHMCEQTQILGVDRDGGFADYAAVPASVVWRNDRAKLPPEIACLQEPFGNAVFATSTQDLAGRAVAVLGCGPVGLFTIAIAKAFGAGRLFASDHVPFRLELAERLGADAVVNVDEVDDVPAWFAEQNEGIGVGVVFEMSGALRAIEDAFGIVRHGGNVVLFGIPSRPATIDIAESLIFKNLTVSAVNGREIWETWYTTRWLLEHGVVDLRPLITAELPLERYEEAFALLESGEACKIVLRPNGATS